MMLQLLRAEEQKKPIYYYDEDTLTIKPYTIMRVNPHSIRVMNFEKTQEFTITYKEYFEEWHYDKELLLKKLLKTTDDAIAVLQKKMNPLIEKQATLHRLLVSVSPLSLQHHSHQ
jgi:hypothetical protein